MTDFETFILDNRGRVFRMWVYKRMFTPYEQEQKYIDESVYECDECSNVFIEEVIELPDKDILLGVRVVYDAESVEKTADEWHIDYYKLSEIRLAYRPKDFEELMEM